MPTIELMVADKRGTVGRGVVIGQRMAAGNAFG
jgi:hypothetical protein